MIDDRLFTPDRREVAEVPMAERCWRSLHGQSAEASADELRSLGRRDPLAAGTIVRAFEHSIDARHRYA